MPELHVFTNDEDWYVAASAEEVNQYQIKLIGDMYDEYYDKFEQVPDEHVVTIAQEDPNLPKDM